MNRAPDPWWVVASQWLMFPIVAPILLWVLRDEPGVRPQWLAFLLSKNYDPKHYRKGTRP